MVCLNKMNMCFFMYDGKFTIKFCCETCLASYKIIFTTYLLVSDKKWCVFRDLSSECAEDPVNFATFFRFEREELIIKIDRFFRLYECCSSAFTFTMQYSLHHSLLFRKHCNHTPAIQKTF